MHLGNLMRLNASIEDHFYNFVTLVAALNSGGYWKTSGYLLIVCDLTFPYCSHLVAQSMEFLLLIDYREMEASWLCFVMGKLHYVRHHLLISELGFLNWCDIFTLEACSGKFSLRKTLSRPQVYNNFSMWLYLSCNLCLYGYPTFGLTMCE